MLRRQIYEHFGIYAEEIYQAGSYITFSSNGTEYLLAPDPGHSDKEWEELIRWAEQLGERGEQLTAVFVPPISKGFAVPVDGHAQVLFKIPRSVYEERCWMNVEDEGEMLGAFHERTSALFLPQQSRFFVERWCEWWMQRIEQLESWYGEVRKKTRFTVIDRWFLQTLPYYIGRTENAIQYMRESLDNIEMSDHGSICHFQFTNASWIVLNERSAPVKIPADWLYDHPSRDIAEWIRHEWLEGADIKRTKRFIDGYESSYKFTTFMRKLVFGRLLFPYHYVEQMERLYLLETPAEEEKSAECIKVLWEKEREHVEQLSLFLKSEIPTKLTEPEWIWNITEKHSRKAL